MLLTPPVDDGILKKSIQKDTFPHYHRDQTSTQPQPQPRSSSILKLHPGSLHQKLESDECCRWFKNLVRRTAEEGTRIHEAIFELLNNRQPKTPLDHSERKRVARFMHWKESVKPHFIMEPENTLISHELGFAGTPDIVCELGGKNYMIDIKTGMRRWYTNILQIESYAQLIEKTKGITIDRIGILLLGESRSSREFFHTEKYEGRRADEFNALVEKWYEFFPEPFGEIHDLEPSVITAA